MSERTARRLRGLLASLLLLAAGAPAASGDGLPAGSDYGAGVRGDTAVPVDDVVAEPERYTGRAVVVEGRISDVCEKKGCWTVLRGERASLRVLHGDHDFALPADCRGQQAYAEGRVEVHASSRRERAHYASESRSGEIPEARDPERSVRLTATGVRLVPREDAAGD